MTEEDIWKVYTFVKNWQKGYYGIKPMSECIKYLKLDMKKYIKPEVTEHKLESTPIMATSNNGCNCGCPKSDVWTGACGCNNGRGCPSCGAPNGGGIVGNNPIHKISSVEDDMTY